MLAFELIPDALEAKWKELAMSQAKWETLEKNEKNFLATLMTGYEGAISYREMMARADEKFRNYLESVMEAREEMLRHKAEINWLETAFEWYRSSNANERARINLR